MMNKKKVLTSLVLGTAMVSQVAVPVFAKEQTNQTPEQDTTAPNEWKADSHTTIGISEVSEDDANGLDKSLNVSFEVPLYVTTAAVGNEETLRTPTEYDIKNNGNRGIVVTAMQIEKLGDWDTVTVAEAAQVTEDKKVELTIGGRKMPATTKKNEKVDVTILKQGDNSVFNKDEKYVVIKKTGGTLAKAPANLGKNTAINKDDKDNILGLNITGKIKGDADRTTKKAAAQFKVTYTVSAITATADANVDKPLNNGGNGGLVTKNDVVGFTYVGDDKAMAQLK